MADFDFYVAKRIDDADPPREVDSLAPCSMCVYQVAFRKARYEQAKKDFDLAELPIICLECATELAKKNNWSIE